MRALATILLLLTGAAAQAQPATPEPDAAAAALELKLFLETRVRADYRVASFNVDKPKSLGPVRRLVHYQARVEFPNGVNPSGRAALRNERVQVVTGSLERLSSERVVVDLQRDAKFINSQRGWVMQVGTTLYPIK